MGIGRGNGKGKDGKVLGTVIEPLLCWVGGRMPVFLRAFNNAMGSVGTGVDDFSGSALCGAGDLIAAVAGNDWGVDTWGVAEARAIREARALDPNKDSRDTFGVAGAGGGGGGATATGWGCGIGVEVWAGGALIVTARPAI